MASKKNQALRTREKINEEYNFHIAQTGHKTATIKLLEEDVLFHVEQACALRKESAKLPTVPVPAEAESPKEVTP